MDDERSWEVRDAVPADAAAIGEFFRAIWRDAGPDAPGFAGATAEVIEEIAAPEAVRARLGGPTRHMVIAVERDDVIGFAATRADDVHAVEVELAGIVVRAAWAGRGVGRAMVREALDGCRRRGAGSAVVRTEVDNEAAIAFYRSLGFERRGETVEQVGDVEVPVVELVLAL